MSSPRLLADGAAHRLGQGIADNVGQPRRRDQRSRERRARIRPVPPPVLHLAHHDPELAEKFGWDEDFAARLAGERRSKVTFDIEPVTQGVKLTVIHDGFEPGSIVVQMVSVGWPDVISSLKTLLETGDPLPAWRRRASGRRAPPGEANLSDPARSQGYEPRGGSFG